MTNEAKTLTLLTKSNVLFEMPREAVHFLRTFNIDGTTQFYILVTVHLLIILINNKLDAQFPLHI
jgi:hypothetical protein